LEEQFNQVSNMFIKWQLSYTKHNRKFRPKNLFWKICS